MKVDLSIRQLELLEGGLFDEIIKTKDEAVRNEFEKLKHHLWKYRAGINKE